MAFVADTRNEFLVDASVIDLTEAVFIGDLVGFGYVSHKALDVLGWDYLDIHFIRCLRFVMRSQIMSAMRS